MLDAALNNVAQGHSQNMATNNFFDHVDPSNNSPHQRLLNVGIRTANA